MHAYTHTNSVSGLILPATTQEIFLPHWDDEICSDCGEVMKNGFCVSCDAVRVPELKLQEEFLAESSVSWSAEYMPDQCHLCGHYRDCEPKLKDNEGCDDFYDEDSFTTPDQMDQELINGLHESEDVISLQDIIEHEKRKKGWSRVLMVALGIFGPQILQ